MSNLLLCCGKPCSGKTTFSKIMEQFHSYIHFSADEWMFHFYEHTTNQSIFSNNLDKCKEMIYRTTEKVLFAKGNVILDFGFWTVEERRKIVNRFSVFDNTVQIIYFPILEDHQLLNLKKRQSINSEKHYTFDKETLVKLNSYFEEPTYNENYTPVFEYTKLRNIPFHKMAFDDNQ